jgi:hypothetical protein
MTDDEIRNYLKPKHNWIGWISGAIAIVTTTYSVAAHFANAPTRSEFEESRNASVQIRLDQATMKGTQERQGIDIGEIKTDVKALRESIEQRKRPR